MTSADDIDEALRSVSGRDSFRLSGTDLSLNVKEAIIGASVVRSIAQAPTLEWDINDPRKELLRSGLYGERVSMGAGPFTFEMVSINKSGTQYTVTGEDQAVAALRRQDGHLKIKKGVMTHVQFARHLVNEIPWLKFKTVPNPSAYGVVKSKEDLTRGHVGKGQNQTSWDALTTNASNRGWRCFIRGVDEVWYVPDKYLYEEDPTFFITEGQDGVDNIDAEFDKGQRLSTLTVTARSALWKVPPGRVANVYDMGIYDGNWLVQDITRSPLDLNTAITLVKPLKILPEPKESSSGGGSAKAGSGGLSSSAATRVAQYAMRAGFSGRNLLIAVMVSFAEDGNHDPKRFSPPNSDGTIDRGLWQINTIHKEYSDADMRDGQKNANAAWKISSQGRNWNPWTTYKSGAYLQFSDAAQRAIDAAHQLDSNKGGGTAPKESNSKRAIDFVAEALSQRHKAYVYGAQTSPSNNDPKSFDCSLLVEWAAGRVGVSLPRTAGQQYFLARAHGTTCSVEHAAKIRGAVLYEATTIARVGLNVTHTAISLGNGETIEARGAAYGVNEFGIKGRPFNYAALIPGMRY